MVTLRASRLIIYFTLATLTIGLCWGIEYFYQNDVTKYLSLISLFLFYSHPIVVFYLVQAKINKKLFLKDHSLYFCRYILCWRKN